MTVQFAATFNEGRTEYSVTLWDKCPGKERLYIKYADGGKDLAYYDLNSQTLVVTRSTWNAPKHRTWFEEAANAYLASVVIASESPVAKPAEIPVIPTPVCEKPQTGREQWDSEHPIVRTHALHLDYLGADYDEL